VLLLAAAAHHFARVRCCDLNPWLGGGFGMFSTADARRLRAWRVDAGGDRRVPIPDDLADAAERCEALPDEARLRSLATALAAAPEQAGAAVRVEVWRTRFGADLRPEPQRLRAVTVDAAPAPR
jgi:hypothetical protein